MARKLLLAHFVYPETGRYWMYHNGRTPASRSALAVKSVQFPALSSLGMYTVLTAY